jgi:hypothetical protein
MNGLSSQSRKTPLRPGTPDGLLRPPDDPSFPVTISSGAESDARALAGSLCRCTVGHRRSYASRPTPADMALSAVAFELVATLSLRSWSDDS